MCELIATVTKPSKTWHKKQHQNKHKTQINTTTSNYQKKNTQHQPKIGIHHRSPPPPKPHKSRVAIHHYHPSKQ
jgi:hypothetical protein